ncbi:elongation factor P maturation arginine rhamnosyltransferase EarP, partial [Pseudacidovorax intermedius]|uniref:elongation factor P maturation arginine rhamnosyltransferase EarP n=1 Tax=Pseudacidovorax intermedius TaxID=433924 RepID=UPI0005BBC275
RPTRVLVAAGRTAEAVRAVLPQLPADRGALHIDWLPHLAQPDFDHLLWAADFNAVRGEDSLVRALWARKPMVWHIYPQDDGVHHDKLDAWLDALDAPASVRAFHAAWNGRPGAPALPALDDALLADATRMVQAARARLLAQDDLLTRLVRFIAQKS